MVMTVTETSTLMVYEGTTLKWSAQLSFPPVSLGRANFQVNCRIPSQICFFPISDKDSPILNRNDRMTKRSETKRQKKKEEKETKRGPDKRT